MLDINFIRRNPQKVKDGLMKRGVIFDVDSFLEIDKKRKETLRALESIRAEKNRASKEIIQIKDEAIKRSIILRMRELDTNSDRLLKELKIYENDLNDILLSLPNLPLDDVPLGKSEEENIVLKRVGKLPKFKFPPKNYLEIAERFELIDIERAAKIAGTRFGMLKREAVLIEFAIVQLVLETLIKENFTPVIPPVMLKKEMAKGTGYFESVDEKEAYFLPQDNLFLTGTSEQALISMHANDIFQEEELPKRYVAFSSCFRREAGSYGKDTKGILRVHQFDKLEMVSFCRPEDSKKEHKFLISLQEKLMKKIKIPYQVVQICTGDMGRPAAAQYDIESWLPSEGRYRETHSTSNCTDFQARRLNIRYRTKYGKTHFVHTLNATAFAIGRILVMILENYQKKDGTFKIPEILKKYLGSFRKR